MNMKDILTVNIYTVQGSRQPIECDDIQIPVQDSANGSFSGSYGIRVGHAPAVFSVKAGVLRLSFNGKVLLESNISDGFATVENNKVCITIESIADD